MGDGLYRGSTPVYGEYQKNVPVFQRFFLRPLILQFRISKYNYGKRYKIVYDRIYIAV